MVEQEIQKEKKAIKDETKSVELFESSSKSKKSVFIVLLKNVFFGILSLIIFSATMYADQVSYVSNLHAASEYTLVHSTNIPDYEIRTNDLVSTGDNENIEILLSGNGILRLDKNTDLQVINLDNKSKIFEFKLLKGNFWGNTSFDNYDIKISTDNIYIQPKNAAFNISYDGSLTKIFSYRHDLYVGVVNNNEEINSFWLADGNSVQIPNSKITEKSETIKKLLYSKLIKEFNYGKVSETSIKNDKWLLAQIEKDNQFSTDFKNQYFTQIRESGLKTISTQSIRYQLKVLVGDLQNTLTISSQKRIAQFLDVLFENLFDAQYLLLQGNSIDANVRLTIFREDIKTPKLIGDEYYQKALFLRLNQELIEVFSITPIDVVYPVKKELQNQLFSVEMYKFLDDEAKFKLLTYKFNDINDAAPTDPQTALAAFNDYFELYKKIMQGYKDKQSTISAFILRQNILVDNFLLKYPKLYKLEIFENKKIIENDYIASIIGSNDKKEQRQTFISNKIDLLIKIKYFLFDDLLNPEDARKIVFVLIQDIEDLKKDTLDLAAVNELFNKRLSDFGIFWQYLNSPEYSTTPLHGATHEQRFTAFKAIQKEIITFQDVQKEILGQEEQEVLTVAGILAIALSDLNNQDIQDIEFGFFNDIKVTRIPVLNAKVSGISFRATYDWDRQLLSNIMVNQKLISQEGVKLENAKKVIVQAISTPPVVIVKEEVISQPVKDPQADIKNAARVFVVEKFTKSGMIITKEQVNIIDFDKGEYEIKDVYYKDNEKAVFSFNYVSKGDKISNLIIQTEFGSKPVTDTFISAFLKPVVLKIYDEARAQV